MEVREPVGSVSDDHNDDGARRVDMKSPNEVSEILRQAADIVVAADIPKELQPVAYGKAVELISDSIQLPERGTSKHSDSRDGDPVGRIASTLKVERDVVEDTYEITDDGVSLVVSPSKLEQQKTKATKQIALLVAAARQATGEEWTQSKTIRAVVDDYGKLDGPNFASSISELGDFLKFAGSGPARRLKLRRSGFDEAAALIKQLHGGKRGV